MVTKDNIKKIVIIAIVIFVVLQLNPFRIYNNDRTEEQTYAKSPQTFSMDSESYVLGSLIEGRQYSFVSGLGRLARPQVTEKTEDWFHNVQMSYKMFNEDWFYDGQFEHYFSQLGAQGLLFRIMDVALGSMSGVDKLVIMQTFNLIILSIVLSIIGFYLWKRFNLWVTVFFLIGTLVNQWIPLSSVNLYWVTWTMFLPMAIAAVYCLKDNSSKKRKIIYMSLLTLAVIYRCACGFEFISTILIAMMIPFIEYEVTHFSSIKKSIKNLLIPTICGISGFIICALLQFTRYLLDGWGFQEALKIFTTIVVKRTYGNLNTLGVYNEELESNLKEPIFDVIINYFNTSAFNIPIGNTYFEMKYWMIILVIVIAIIALIYNYKKTKDIKSLSIVIITFISFLAPLSWFVLAKGHAAAHYHLDPLLWQIPFTGIGLGLIGYFTSVIFYNKKREG